MIVGDQILELSYVGPFHSKGDIVIYSPAHKVVMAVDLFHPNAAPFQYFGIARDMDGKDCGMFYTIIIIIVIIKIVKRRKLRSKLRWKIWGVFIKV